MAAPENREQRTENREQRTENREQRTERATSARRRERWENVEGFEKNTKDTKDHEGSQRLPEWGVQMFLRFARKTFGSSQIKAD